MPLAPYDPAAGGPSSAAQMATLQGQDQITSKANYADLRLAQGRNRQQFLGLNKQGQQTGYGTAGMLSSSLGANGQLGSTAAKYAQGEAGLEFQNQQADLSSAFNRSQMDLKRQEVFASMGLIL